MGPPGDPPMSWTTPRIQLLSDPQYFLDRGPLDELFDVLVELEALRCCDGVLVVGELEELIRQVRVPRLVETTVLPQTPGDGAQYRVGHAREVAQRLVPVLAGAKVDLRHRVEADHLEGVYHD